MLQQSTSSEDGTTKEQNPPRAEDAKHKVEDERIIRVGSRKSNLALIQTNKVIGDLTKFYSKKNPNDLSVSLAQQSARLTETDWDYEFQIIAMTTTGDNILNHPLPSIGTKSLFTRELETALLNKEVDFIVHSLKDLPTTLPEGCVIGAILQRDDVNDVLVLKKSLQGKFDPISILQAADHEGAQKSNINIKIGTSSQRRIALIRRCNPVIECIDIRGNLNTRFRKLDNEQDDYTAIVLAAAGLDRMNMSERASLHLDPQNDDRLNGMTWPYAVGQGAIAVECRENDSRILKILQPIVCLKTTYEAAAERAMMKHLEGGCSVPMGVRTRWLSEHHLELSGAVLSLDGRNLVESKSRKNLDHDEFLEQVENLADLTGIVMAGPHSLVNIKHLGASVRLGREVAKKLIDGGAKEILQLARAESKQLHE